MIKVSQRVPNFVDAKGGRCEVETFDELCEVPFIKNFMSRDNFGGFAKEYDGHSMSLMSVSKDGKEWWVVGSFSGKAELPYWKPNVPYNKLPMEYNG